MQKEELIQLHTFMVQLKSYFEKTCGDDGNIFQEYENLNVTPCHIYKSKREHTLAVFTLGKSIAELLSQKGYPGFDKISARLEQIADKFRRKK